MNRQNCKNANTLYILFYGLPDSTINRLQRIPKSLARVVMPFVKPFDHISSALHKLHLLPIRKRIIFKIATLTFKILQSHQPSYLFNILTTHNPSRSLRSSLQHLLITPRITSEMGRRSFAYAAPTIWNSLPPSIRSIQSLITFRRSLKTYLYPP